MLFWKKIVRISSGSLIDYTNSTKVSEYLCTKFQGFCLDFLNIKPFGVPLPPIHPQLLHHWRYRHPGLLHILQTTKNGSYTSFSILSWTSSVAFYFRCAHSMLGVSRHDRVPSSSVMTLTVSLTFAVTSCLNKAS